ncbi:hypothetical protein RclHR1_17480005 [Rhizophagus clarus]|uniref:BTB domain-containing protein n=1 Tax=Rhizophagus clarus TaxID=94130 RepID=A0A2Z6QP38_9GLOM|nr:hypothetical protein RclHR1_17480005 [Rhizophagus clarus]
MSYKFLQKLSQNLLEIFEDDEEYYDITIEVGNDPYVKIFRAHMVILNYRSSYLRRILSTNRRENDGTLVQIKLPNILPEIFQIILRYIYGGEPTLKDCDNLDIIKILVAASELNIQELVIYTQSFLIEHKTNWMEQNFNLIYQTSFENNSFLELQKYCTDLVSKTPEKIFKSLDLSSISEKLLISLIQNDNLQMREIEVWENVLKWGLAQNPELSSDPSTYSKEDFNSLKNTLQKCIPFIRFYDLTSKEFSDYILPYKEILSEELYMDLLKTFLNLHPNSKPTHKSNSRIIEKRLTTSASTDNEKEPSSWSSVLPQTSSSFDSWDLREKTKKTDQTSDSWNLRVKTHQESKYPWRRESTHQESKNPQRTESTHQESKNPRIRESTHQESKNPRIRESTHQESKNPRRTESTRQESKNLWGHSSTDKEPDTLGCAVN